MSLHDYFDNEDTIYNQTMDSTDDWMAQTFTPSEDYTIASVKLFLGQRTTGSLTGTVIVSIKETDGNGHPIGSDLIVGTVSTDIILEGTGNIEWVEFIFTVPCNLNSGTKYAIVIRGDNVMPGRVFTVAYNNAEYAGGNLELSVNGGEIWTGYSQYDVLFKTYEDILAPPPRC